MELFQPSFNQPFNQPIYDINSCQSISYNIKFHPECLSTVFQNNRCDLEPIISLMMKEKYFSSEFDEKYYYFDTSIFEEQYKNFIKNCKQ